ncbi:MAG: helix-turn-helix domain-containing protein [Clostridia bacterium]|nr:helix-turn-helix domain-containing protein [Clostridia bacterium]
MNDFSKRILQAIENTDLSYRDLAKLTGIPSSTLQRYANGHTEKIPIDKLEAIANATGVTAAYLMGWEDEPPKNDDILDIPGIMPLPKFKKIPLLGTIACGEPILAEENVDGYVRCPEDVDADFGLRCKGDSMIGARIHDGDIVYIRQQPDIENGEIAAVLIDDEATLKRVYKSGDSIILQPENPAYAPRVFVREEINQIRILGKAVCFLSRVK